MKQLKKLFLFVVLLIAAGNVYSQDLISTVNGKFYWVNEKSGMIEKLDEVGVEDG